MINNEMANANKQSNFDNEKFRGKKKNNYYQIAVGNLFIPEY